MKRRDFDSDSRYELVFIWDTGEKEIAVYPTEADAEQAGRNIKKAFGNQISWWGTRPKLQP